MKKITLLMLLMLANATTGSASDINRITLAELQAKADIVVMAKVTKVVAEGDADHVTIKVDSCLKGNVSQDVYTFTLVTRGGLKDFDPTVKMGDSGVFFLKSKMLKGGVEKAYWGGVAIFPKNHFDLTKENEESQPPASGDTCWASDMVRATLEPSTNRAGVFTIHVTNVSSNVLRFLDIREGSASCGEFYEVTVEKDGKTHESKGNCLYASIGIPRVVELAPNQTYDREIDPGAYVFWRGKHLSAPCTIMVTYRLTDKIKTQWSKMKENINTDLVFKTQKVEIKASTQPSEGTR